MSSATHLLTELLLIVTHVDGCDSPLDLHTDVVTGVCGNAKVYKILKHFDSITACIYIGSKVLEFLATEQHI